MNIELKGRKAIVTGSTAGIGRATAEGLDCAGASLVINGPANGRVNEAMRPMQHPDCRRSSTQQQPSAIGPDQ